MQKPGMWSMRCEPKVKRPYRSTRCLGSVIRKHFLKDGADEQNVKEDADDVVAVEDEEKENQIGCEQLKPMNKPENKLKKGEKRTEKIRAPSEEKVSFLSWFGCCWLSSINVLNSWAFLQMHSFLYFFQKVWNTKFTCQFV